MRVGAGELPETLRLARPPRMVAFGKQDAVAGGYAAAVSAARGQGFEAVLRLAGGRAAVFHEGTIGIAHAVHETSPRAGMQAAVRVHGRPAGPRPERARSGRAGGGGAGRVLPRHLQRERGRRAEARRRRTAPDRERGPRGLGDRGGTTRPACGGCSCPSTRRSASNGIRRRRARRRPRVPESHGSACATRCSPSTGANANWCRQSSTSGRSSSRLEFVAEHRAG